MAPSNRHRRAIPRVISPPFPVASNTMVLEPAGEHRWSNEGSLDPAHGYSALFTSGFLQTHLQRSTPSSDHDGTPEIIHGPFHPSPQPSPHNYLSAPSPSPTKTPARRHRSSIMHSTPMSASPRVYKSGGADNGVERALDNVLRSLKGMAMSTPVRDSPLREQSRWSMSSEESGHTEESGLWRPRQSEESTRSRVTVGTMRSTRSLSRRSKKSRRSEDTERMELDMEEDVPPVPVPDAVTPSRRKRMMEGLAKRLGLTPKKQLPPLPETEVPPTPRLARKSSFSALKSTLARKTSISTLRSVRSTKSSNHPFMGSGPTLDCEAYPPPLPSWRPPEVPDGCVPVTPRRRNPKPSIGQPYLQRSTSPSSFLKDLPRRPPTRLDDNEEVPPVPDMQPRFTAPLRPVRAISLRDKLRRAEQRTRQDRAREDTPELSPSVTVAYGYGTPQTTSSTLVNTPMTPLDTPRGGAGETISFDAYDTLPLTHRSAQDAFKPKRLLKLLPESSRTKLGMQTPAPTGLRSKKSTISRPVLGEVTHRGINTPDDITAILARANQSKHPFASGQVDFTNASPPSPRPAPRRDVPIMMDQQEVAELTTDFTRQPRNDERGVAQVRPPRFFDGPSGDTLGTDSWLSSRKRDGVPDFTLSPDASFMSLTRASSVYSDISLDSVEPTEQWELEACLGALERVDREREDAAEIGVGR